MIMQISKPLLKELAQILKEEFSLELNKKDLLRFANCILGYFSLLIKIEGRSQNGKC